MNVRISLDPDAQSLQDFFSTEEPCYTGWLHGRELLNSNHSTDVSLNSIDSLSEDMLFDCAGTLHLSWVDPSFHDSSLYGNYSPKYDLLHFPVLVIA